ncbi:hypothetical protein [Meiothermus taiwanensis]|jgi:hypothetical protein|uniref:Transcription antiterminator BglG n=3 Tax=Meiothermus taiwanensis TaxID=172827 RepID=A0A399E0W1_9DEIN|nr:hypothetical protein [Meiothermus taiwanensis]AWR88063.1 hypothetical protein Mtai_v1c28400 [Meiothermus taiwanensis WR-220]KIQ54227.1 transcription antiterminator BglG [Meiothermus taiwanensis]KZK15808.1 transcription antiterminator BglG [Meiothermus taiwanensis]RIH77179.1 hypothetical protein Mcate_01432 [Meiothermus taiwanensis]
MVDLWLHALNLDRAVQQGGVAQACIAQEDFEGAKPLMQKVWRGERWGDLLKAVRSQGEELVPARVLLGYLRGYFFYREVPENDDALWSNFLQDLGIKDQNLPTKAQYDRLWEALEWHPETRFRLQWSKGGKRDFISTLDAIFHFRALRLNVLKEAFLSFYSSGELPAQAQPYKRVFRRLKEAMEVLLEEGQPPALDNEQAVLGFLEAAGLYLGEPHPVRLLFNRSDQALKDLYWKLKGERPVSKRPRPRHRQVRVELLNAPPGLEEIQPALSPAPLVEGWRVYGKVVLEDGRFKRFSWVPRRTPDGAPLPEELEVSFEEGETVRFRLHHKAFAVRFSQPVWSLGEPLEVHPVDFDPAEHPLRYLFASGGEARESLEKLAEEIGETSILEDELIVEIRIDGRVEEWRGVARLPFVVQARLEAWVEPHGAFVRTHPPGLAVCARVLAGERLVEEKQIRPEGQGALVARAGLFPLRVELVLRDKAVSLSLPPKGRPRDWWRLGLGLGGAARGV